MPREVKEGIKRIHSEGKKLDEHKIQYTGGDDRSLYNFINQHRSNKFN